MTEKLMEMLLKDKEMATEVKNVIIGAVKENVDAMLENTYMLDSDVIVDMLADAVDELKDELKKEIKDRMLKHINIDELVQKVIR